MNKQDYLKLLQKKKQIAAEEKLMNKYIKECATKYIAYYFPNISIPKNFINFVRSCNLKEQSITIYIQGDLSKNLKFLLTQNNMQSSFKMHTKYLNQEELENLKQERKLELL